MNAIRQYMETRSKGKPNMNGSMYQIAQLVSYVKKSIRDGMDIPFEMSSADLSISFTFSDEGFLLRKNETADNVQDWYRSLQKKKLAGIRMYINVAKNDPRLAGFANAQAEGIVTAYKNGHVTYWIPHWSFDQEKKGWNIHYTEVLWKNMRMEYLDLDDPTDDFKTVLKNIDVFAREIGFGHFADCFLAAYEMLNKGEAVEAPEWMKKDLYLFSNKTLCLLCAASKSDVFGGMGSWNDSPPYYAHDLGREEEYKQLSHELFVQNRRAVMYAVNQ